MPLPVIPIALGVGTLYAWHRASKRQKMTPERKKAFEDAIKTTVAPEQVEAHVQKLGTLADAFEKEGLRAEAGEIRKRIKVIQLSPEKKAEYKQAYKKGLSASDPESVKKLASALHEKGFYGSAKNLRDYAEGLIKNLSARLTSKPQNVQTEPSVFAPEPVPVPVPNQALEVENASSTPNPPIPVSD